MDLFAQIKDSLNHCYFKTSIMQNIEEKWSVIGWCLRENKCNCKDSDLCRGRIQ